MCNGLSVYIWYIRIRIPFKAFNKTLITIRNNNKISNTYRTFYTLYFSANLRKARKKNSAANKHVYLTTRSALYTPPFGERPRSTLQSGARACHRAIFKSIPWSDTISPRGRPHRNLPGNHWIHLPCRPDGGGSRCPYGILQTKKNLVHTRGKKDICYTPLYTIAIGDTPTHIHTRTHSFTAWKSIEI